MMSLIPVGRIPAYVVNLILHDSPGTTNMVAVAAVARVILIVINKTTRDPEPRTRTSDHCNSSVEDSEASNGTTSLSS